MTLDGVPILNGSSVSSIGTLAVHKGKVSLSSIRVIDSGQVWTPSAVTEDSFEYNVLSNARIEIYVLDRLVFLFEVKINPNYTLLATGTYASTDSDYYMTSITRDAYQQREMGHSLTESPFRTVRLGVAVAEDITGVTPVCHNCYIERTRNLNSGEYVGNGAMGYVVLGKEIGEPAWVMLGNVLVWYAPTVI